MKQFYPSQHIQNWIENIRAAFGLNLGARPVCECTAVITATELDEKDRPHFLNGIFWSTWIDQVLYYTLVQGCAGIPADRPLYDQFRQIWPFPKIHAHIPSGMVAPYALFGYGARDLTPLPTRELLLLGKQAFWTDEVARWLVQEMNRPDVVAVAEKEFMSDQKQRSFVPFHERYGMLFDEVR